MTKLKRLFRDYSDQASQYITSQERPFYPDYLVDAVGLYEDVFRRFNELCQDSESSEDLLRTIHRESGDMHKQLLRAFRKYVSPQTSVAMLKVKAGLESVICDFGSTFRSIEVIRERLSTRPLADEALAAVFWEHHDRGTPG